MAVLSLPLTFNNSFWSQDYRKGLEVLFAKLEQGTAENAEVLAFIRARASTEGQLAASLVQAGTPSASTKGFGADDGASLLMTFRGLQEESVSQGKAHQAVASELNTLVAAPFDDWSRNYKERLLETKRNVLDSWVRGYEQAQGEVARSRSNYLAKTQKADDADDDAKFAPVANPPDNYTTSPRVRPVDGRSAPQRTASVSERIAARLKEIQQKSIARSAAASSTDSSTTEKEILKPDIKGKGKEIPTESPENASPPPMSPLPPPKVDIPAHPILPSKAPEPEPILIAGLAFPPAAISQLLTRAAGELPLRPIRFPVIGEYQDCFTGEEFAIWLKDHLEALGDSYERAEDAARDLAENEGLLRRVGEFGNRFEFSDEAFYQFRPKAFELSRPSEPTDITSPIRKTMQQPVAENLLKKTNNFLNVVSKAMNTQNGPAHIKARQDAEEADRDYQVAVRRLDRHRLGLEERVEETLKKMQRWETERLRAVKTALLQFQGIISNLPKSAEHSIERSSTLVAAYNPDSDLVALIERYRTGPFRPSPQVYEPITHDELDVVYGIDLRRWIDLVSHDDQSASGAPQEKADVIPPALRVLLAALQDAYGRLSSDDEKRKSWIYEVPLANTHHLRETLNAAFPAEDISTELLAPYDAPVLASGLKLWLLELTPPLALYEGWEEIRKLYPTVGSGNTTSDNQEQHIEELNAALHKLPRVHLLVLDAVVSHLKQLIDSTTSTEPNEVYLTKLALTVGRAIIRPKVETQISVQDRHPTLLFIDLVNNYDKILPPTISRKKRESIRKMPIRKRTKPVDMRLSRSRLSVGMIDPAQLLAAQQLAQNPSLARSPPSQAQTFKDLPKPVESGEEVKELPKSAVSEEVKELPKPVGKEGEKKEDTEEEEDSDEEEDDDDDDDDDEDSDDDDDDDEDDDDEDDDEDEDEDEDEKEAPETPVPAPPKAQVPPPPQAVPQPGQPPKFKEPPPELDDLPPRPMFKEPPPEDDDAPPARPNFAEPPPEVDDHSGPSSPAYTGSPGRSNISVIPPTPQNKLKRDSRFDGSRSPSPSAHSPTINEDQPLSSARTSIRRAGSGQASAVRGPRVSRGHNRPIGGGSVSNIVNSLNKNTSPTASSPTSPSYKRVSTPGSRPSSVVGRSSLQRRTMASDAEDDVVDRA